jgi:hypothetical protein
MRVHIYVYIYIWHIIMKGRDEVILLVLTADVEIFPRSQRPVVLKY